LRQSPERAITDSQLEEQTMKPILSGTFAAFMLIGALSAGGYVLAKAGTADTPACCQTHESCCPSQSCCKGGSHTAQCPMMHRHA
jgi:hypothetical protein